MSTLEVEWCDSFNESQMFDDGETETIAKMRKLNLLPYPNQGERIIKTFVFLKDYDSKDLWFVCIDGNFASAHTWSFNDV
jgi:hypothetical protein